MDTTTGLPVLMGFYFYPRGGSAHVVRELCRVLAPTEWAPLVLSGSVGGADDVRNATRFFADIPCVPLDYTAAIAAWEDHADPMDRTVPMHASFEDKPDVPDRSFLDLDGDAFDRQVDSWMHVLAGVDRPVICHLHHLTPVHAAVRATWPDMPLVTHLHGTELKMLQRDDAGTPAGALPHGWADAWTDRIRDWAGSSDRVIVVSPQDRRLACDLLPVDPGHVVVIGNGVDPDVFDADASAAAGRTAADRLDRWRGWLLRDPQGSVPGGAAGSLQTSATAMEAFVHDGVPVPVVAFSGRFMEFKRLQLLIEAHHRMSTESGAHSVLVVIGGFPGEWEGEHPVDTVERLGAQGVFFAGWRDHDELAAMLRCSDVFAALSVDEPFGLVFLEAMAAGLAPITSDTGGPATFINVDADAPTGWLVPADDLRASVEALHTAVTNPTERRVRGRRAAAYVRENHTWSSIGSRVEELYEEVVLERA